MTEKPVKMEILRDLKHTHVYVHTPVDVHFCPSSFGNSFNSEWPGIVLIPRTIMATLPQLLFLGKNLPSQLFLDF